MGKSKGGYYAVARGRETGVFNTWEECSARVHQFPGATFKKFQSLTEAQAFLRAGSAGTSRVEHQGGLRAANTTSSAAYGTGPKQQYAYSGLAIAAPQQQYARTGLAIAVPQQQYARTGLAIAVPQQQYARTGLAIAEPLDLASPSSSALSNHFGSVSGSSRKRSADDYDDRQVKRTALAPSHVLDVYADGCALGNGKNGSRAGFGIYFGGPLNHLNESGRLQGSVQTNNRAELTAVIRACELAPPSADLRIHTDSKYTISALNDWQHKWRRNGWRTAKGEDVLNRDLIERIEALFAQRPQRPRLIYVPGHSGIPGNEEADRLAKAGALKPQ